MLIDFRTYTYWPADFYRFLQTYKETGFALTSRWLGRTLGIFTSHSGRANRTLQLFAYRDFAHRDECRAGLKQDQDWQRFIKEAAPFIREQENVILETQSAGWPWPVLEDSAPRGNSGIFELRRERTSPRQVPRLVDAWSKTSYQDRPGPSGLHAVLRPLTGSLDTVYVMMRFESDAARHDAMRDSSGLPPALSTSDKELSIFSSESELWLPTEYSTCR